MSHLAATNTIGSPFIELQSVDSTNNYARQQIHAACLPDRQGLAQHGMTFFAHEQTKGKGQRGRVWITEPGANIVMSILVKPAPLPISLQFQLSACVAVSVHEFFLKYAGDSTKIKWPNDLYWQDRKAGGILIESVVGSRESVRKDSPTESLRTFGGVSTWDWAIIGIGININQTLFPAYLSNPVSLKQMTGNDFNVLALAEELCGILQRRFDELMATGFENIFNTYNSHLYKVNEKVKLKKESRVFEAVIKAVSPDGKLITHHAIEELFDFGDVEWVI